MMIKRKYNKYIGYTHRLSACCGICLLLVVAGITESGAAPEARPVVVATADMREIAPVGWYPGTVVSRAQSEVPAEVEGRLVYVAEVGERLASGDVLAKIDTEIMEQESRIAIAEMKTVQARLSFLEKEVRRLQHLAKQNNAARSKLEQASADLAGAKGELAAAKARMNLARQRLQRCVVTAPFDGLVTRRLLKAGEWANSGSVVAILINTAQLEIQSWIPVTALPFVNPGDTVDMEIAEQLSRGVVRVSVPASDSQSRLYELRITPESQDLHVGQSVRVAIPAALPQQVLAVPRDALVLRRNSISLFRINDKNIAENLPVATGIASEDMIEVTGDLQPGDRVVIRGGERLREGLSVTVQPLGGL